MKPKSRVLRLTQNRFVRNVAVVASGTAAVQVINMAFSPVLARLYGPSAFGALGIFTALVNVLIPLAALGYPFAIVLPKLDRDALGIAKLSIGFTLVTSLVTASVLLAFTTPLTERLALGAIESVIWLVPLVFLSKGLLQVVREWSIRKKLFRLKAKAGVAAALITNAAIVATGVLSHTGPVVLVTLSGFGVLLQLLILFISVQRIDPLRIAPLGIRGSWWRLARDYSDFPLYRSPQIFINTASQSLPVLLLGVFFGPSAAGLYTLGRQVVGLPATLIAQSVSEVFYPRISEAGHRRENCHDLILRGTIALAAVGVVPFGVLILLSPQLFTFVFGEAWATAGEYARWLSIMLFFNFINRPSVAAVPVLGLQRGLLIYEILSTAGKFVALYIGFAVFKSDIVAVAAFSVCGAAAYLGLILWVLSAAHTIAARAFHEPKTSS